MSDSNFNAKHPDSSFTATYPYNMATITRGGHEFHINDTVGSESLKWSHTNGTYIEWCSNSSQNTATYVCTGKEYDYYTDGVSITADGHYDLKIAGTYNINITLSKQETVASNSYYTVLGNATQSVGGTNVIYSKHDKYESVGGNLTESIGGDRCTTANNTVDVIENTRVDIINGDWSATVFGRLEFMSNNVVRVIAPTILFQGNMTVNGNFGTTSGATGSFTTPSGNIVTVRDGIITNII